MANSKYSELLSVEEVKSRLFDCDFDRSFTLVDSYGMATPFHAYVHPHAMKNLRIRGESRCEHLLVDWVYDFMKLSVELLESVAYARDDQDCDKFFVLDRDTGRVLTFSVLPQQNEVSILIQSVIFLNQVGGVFYVGTPEAKCFRFSRGNNVQIGIENIPEMTK